MLIKIVTFSFILLVKSLTSFAQIDSLDNFAVNERYQLYSNKPHKFTAKQLFIPTALVSIGVISICHSPSKKTDNEISNSLRLDRRKTTVDNYTQFAGPVTAYGLNLIGIKGRHNLADLTIIYSSTQLLTTLVVQSIKRSITVTRPDGVGGNSFPSGHTATAFAGAEILRLEYKETSPWIGIAGYAFATYTGLCRIYNNRHRLSDVIAGAGFGILCAKTVYWLYPISNFTKKANERQKKYTVSFMPYYDTKQAGFALGISF